MTNLNYEAKFWRRVYIFQHQVINLLRQKINAESFRVHFTESLRRVLLKQMNLIGESCFN